MKPVDAELSRAAGGRRAALLPAAMCDFSLIPQMMPEKYKESR